MKSGKYPLPTFLAISMFCSLVAAQQGATTSSSATVPRLVNFTGKTADAQGKPIAGIAGVTLAIYKDQYEGAPLWLKTQNVQADTKGNYTVQLGATRRGRATARATHPARTEFRSVRFACLWRFSWTGFLTALWTITVNCDGVVTPPSVKNGIDHTPACRDFPLE